MANIELFDEEHRETNETIAESASLNSIPRQESIVSLFEVADGEKHGVDHDHWLFSFEIPVKKRIHNILMKRPLLLLIFATLVSFTAYFANYGLSVFPFVSRYEGQYVGDLQLKVAFTLSQMAGYALSKIGATIFMPGLARKYRCTLLCAGALFAELCLVFFAFTPPIVQIILVFLNGVPLAWTWGLMMRYLEGRRFSEILVMALYLSVMVAGGLSRSWALATIEGGIPEMWTPAVCGGICSFICVLCFQMLDCLPDPDEGDVALRHERKPMTPKQANKFLREWGFGIMMVTIVYALLTTLRNFRDYFAPEIFSELMGQNYDASAFTQSEVPIGIATTLVFAMLVVVKDDRKGFNIILALMIFGSVSFGAFTLMFYSGVGIPPILWMILVGASMYISFIPPGATFYDRLNGATGVAFTSVFMVYFSDLFGCAATLSVLLVRNFGPSDLSFLDFFVWLAMIVSVVSVVGLSAAFAFFWIKMRHLTVNHVSTAQLPQ